MHERTASRRRFRTFFWLTLLGVAAEVGAISVPAGFGDEDVANVDLPTALAFAPDARLLIAAKDGQLWVHQDGALVPGPALDLAGSICTNSERGLLGVAVDPEFAVNRHVYLFYTARSSGACGNRVSRFVLSDENGIGGETILLDRMPSPSGSHNAGDLQFGHDGLLYVTVGDGSCDYAAPASCGDLNDAARDLHALVGKVLRITSTGAIPPGNPFAGRPNGVRCNLSGLAEPGNLCQEIFATGLRNPFRMAFDPNTPETRFYINDVGQNTWEEIDLGQAGADYGWNVREGPCAVESTTQCAPPPSAMTNPIFAYSHMDPDPHFRGCASITGGAFIPAGVWPVEFEGAYLFGDYVCGKIFSLMPSNTVIPFATGLGVDSAVSMVFGPHRGTQALYYTTFADTDGDGFPNGQVRRIAFVGTANRNPQAVGQATPTSGPTPLQVAFSGRESTDADGDPLSFVWDFGDGTPPVSVREITHTYETSGAFTATLRVDDGHGGTDTDSIRIDPGHTPPLVRIDSPAPDLRFRVGQAITLSGHAVDEAGHALPDAELQWTVRLHHDTHTHPFLDPTPGNGISIVTPRPEDLPAATTSFLEIRLTATDARGLSHTVTQELRPRLVTLKFITEPRRLKLRIQGTTLRAPQRIVSWPRYRIQVAAPKQMVKGQAKRFRAWSNGRARRHTITTPSKARSYRAFFD